MSVRVCYLRRGTLGATLRGLRLLGHATDERWPGTGEAPDVDTGARWLRDRLVSSRAGASLSLLCLDVEGGVCSWLSAPAGSAATGAMIGAIARGMGGAGEGEGESGGGRRAASPVEYYAGDPYSSSIQSLEVGDGGGAALKRMPVLAVSDVPARLLLDALDRQNVSVEAAASLWHVMAHAWDPAAVPASGGDAVEAEAPVTGVLVVDVEAGRLLWTWSSAGQLLVAGSVRLRRVAAESTELVEADGGMGAGAPLVLTYGEQDVSRLTVEWLAWAAQVGRAPARLVCVLADRAQAGAFGHALGEAWKGASVDVVVQEDPVGATLSRAVDVLERTPAGGGEDDPAMSLVELTSRPGRSHRRLYMWWSGAIAAAALLMGVVGWQMNSAAAESRDAAAEWRGRQEEAIRQVLPDARAGPGRSTLMVLKDEVGRRAKELAPAKQLDSAATMPILEELQTLSFVVGNSGLSLESIELDSQFSPRFSVLANTTRDAEDLLVALGRVAGSHVSDWSPLYSARTEGGVQKVRGTYSGKWAVKGAAKPAAGAANGGVGSASGVKP